MFCWASYILILCPKFSNLYFWQEALLLYARLQLNLTRGADDGSILIEQLLDVVCKDLDQSSSPGTLSRWAPLSFFFPICFYFILLAGFPLFCLISGVIQPRMISLEHWAIHNVVWWNLLRLFFTGYDFVLKHLVAGSVYSFTLTSRIFFCTLWQNWNCIKCHGITLLTLLCSH